MSACEDTALREPRRRLTEAQVLDLLPFTTIRTDANGNRASDKRKPTHRIDGTVALIMALAMAPAAQMRPFDAAALIV